VFALPLRSGAIRLPPQRATLSGLRRRCVGNLRCGRGREVDALTTPLLHICIREQLATAPTHLILDLQPVRFLGCTGLTCLLDACLSWLLGGPSYGGDEYVDQVAAGLRARAVEHCVRKRRAVSGSVSLTIGSALAVRVSWTGRRLCGSGVRHTSPAWVSRSTIAEVAGEAERAAGMSAGREPARGADMSVGARCSRPLGARSFP
jgi:hypothetical protein